MLTKRQSSDIISSVDTSSEDISRVNIARINIGGVALHDKLIKKYIPMTETIYYALCAMNNSRHGYGIMQFVAELTDNRVKMGAGTLYTMLGRLLEDELIYIVSEENGKKVYGITETGRELLFMETVRLGKQLENGMAVLGERRE